MLRELQRSDIFVIVGREDSAILEIACADPLELMWAVGYFINI